MTEIETIGIFVGWCSLINLALLILTSICIVSLRGFVSKIHSKMFGINESDLGPAYFRYLGQYKIAIIGFNLVPYIALKIMS